MIINDFTKSFLTERVHDVVYHTTPLSAAVKILSSGYFSLSSSMGTEMEKTINPPGYNYYLSTSRSKMGDYQLQQGSDSVTFKLSGEWFNQQYKSKPVDYWERSWQYSGRTSEQEDRVFSKNPKIPIDPILEAHLFIDTSWDAARTRKFWLLCKQNRIPCWIYTRKKYWLLQQKDQAKSFQEIKHLLRGQEKTGKTWTTTDRIKPWLELWHATRKNQLSDKAKNLEKELRYRWREDDDLGLSHDIGNQRRPDSEYYTQANKLIDIMTQKGWGTRQFVDFLSTKWKTIAIADQHQVDFKVIQDQLNKGISIEKEHTPNPRVAEKIAMDHLRENPKYYDILAQTGL